MDCIKILTDEDFGLKSQSFDKPRVRLGARGIVLNDENQIAILYKEKKREYKLIGGGVEPQEEPMIAFQREVYEESGCEIKIVSHLGMIEEHKSLDNFKQISFVYVAKVINNSNITHFTEQEKKEGAKLLWLTLDNAIEQLKKSESYLLPSKYEGNMSVYHTKFIVRRDYEILKYFKEYHYGI